jgi:hypothetical protein
VFRPDRASSSRTASAQPLGLDPDVNPARRLLVLRLNADPNDQNPVAAVADSSLVIAQPLLSHISSQRGPGLRQLGTKVASVPDLGPSRLGHRREVRRALSPAIYRILLAG